LDLSSQNQNKKSPSQNEIKRPVRIESRKRPA